MMEVKNLMYEIGFTQGAFDMFHIGHLNLIKNAKAQCKYLIVGINSDELIKSYKSKEAIIPISERMAIVEAIKYVDEVVITDTLDKMKIVKEKKCNAIFVGSDWKDNARWLKTKEEMHQIGVDVIFLPYTEKTSSTLISEKLNNY